MVEVQGFCVGAAVKVVDGTLVGVLTEPEGGIVAQGG